MMWHWKVRIHNATGRYWHGQIQTGRDLREIDGIQDFYFALTGCKMLLEGMSEAPFDGTDPIGKSFRGLWSTNGTLEIPA